MARTRNSSAVGGVGIGENYIINVANEVRWRKSDVPIRHFAERLRNGSDSQKRVAGEPSFAITDAKMTAITLPTAGSWRHMFVEVRSLNPLEQDQLTGACRATSV